MTSAASSAATAATTRDGAVIMPVRSMITLTLSVFSVLLRVLGKDQTG
jgi:hypothetical protein